jgi:zinc transporter 9
VIVFPSPAVVPKLSKDRSKDKTSFSNLTTGRNFITPIRAMNEYLLKPNDLNELRKFQRRSPYANEPPITVYLRKDIETKYVCVSSRSGGDSIG